MDELFYLSLIKPGDFVNIWVDADACPQPVKSIVMNASVKRKVHTIFVANQNLNIPQSQFTSFVLVDKTPDAADHHIHREAIGNDLVITADIPLAHALVSNGILVIDHRGTVFDEDNIHERLSIRDLMSDLRDQGEVKGGPRPYSDKDKRLFASTFDRVLTKLLRS